MKNEKALFLWVLLILIGGMIGCSSGGSSSGTSTTATTTTTTTTTTSSTDALVGTWRCTSGNAASSMTFNANGTGSISDGHTITSWSVTGTTLNMTIPQPEAFTLTYTNTARTTMSLFNLSPSAETSTWAK
jgi:hypothetical protein